MASPSDANLDLRAVMAPEARKGGACELFFLPSVVGFACRQGGGGLVYGRWMMRDISPSPRFGFRIALCFSIAVNPPIFY